MPRTERVVLLLLLMALCGCEFGRTTVRMNRDHVIPYPEMSTLPTQWEPEPASS